MKKLLIAVLLGLSASVFAATDTPTPTFTPTLTWTPTPISIISGSTSRVVVDAVDVCANDGVVLASAVTTPLPGAAAPWLAQSMSFTAAVMSTGSAKCRIQFVLPNDYQRFLSLYAYASTTATPQTLTMTLNLKRQAFGASSSATYTAKVLLGTATSMLLTYPGLQGASTKMVRAKLPLPTCNDCKAGDLINVDVQRSGGTTTDLYIYRFEAQYDAKQGIKP